MDLSDRISHIGGLSRISKRVPALSPSHRAIARAGLSLIIALGIGYLAWQWSGAEALDSWRRGHPPSALLWNSTLESTGFREIRDPRLLARLPRTLPSLTEPDGTWIAPGEGTGNENPVWLARIGDPVRFYSRDPGGAIPPADHWRSLGGGWAALEDFRRITGGQRPAVPPKTKGKLAVRDPREIVF